MLEHTRPLLGAHVTSKLNNFLLSLKVGGQVSIPRYSFRFASWRRLLLINRNFRTVTGYVCFRGGDRPKHLHDNSSYPHAYTGLHAEALTQKVASTLRCIPSKR